MESVASFTVLGLLVVIGAYAADRARRYWLDSGDRDSLESLTGLATADGLNADERKTVALLVESHLHRQARSV